jgi:hypothetical protein
MVTITYSSPNTGYSAPDTQEAGRLLKIVDAACPWINLRENVEIDEFRRALASVGLMFRTAEPVSKFAFGHFVDAANELVATHGRGGEVGGVALMGAVLGHGDVCWRQADASLGQLLELGLDRHSGRQCSNAWRGLLTGERNIMPPTPPRGELVDRAAKGQPAATFWKRDDGGALRSVAPDERLWRR